MSILAKICHVNGCTWHREELHHFLDHPGRIPDSDRIFALVQGNEFIQIDVF